MEKGTLARWLVAVGDVIKPGDLLAEIETDKATMDFEAVDEGRIASLIVSDGTDDVAVGTTIALIAGKGEGDAAQPAAAVITAPLNPTSESLAATSKKGLLRHRTH